jgi:hypothetical protein
MKILRTFVVLAWVVVVCGVRAAQVSAGMVGYGDITLTWSDDPKTTQTISWKSDASVSVSSITYAVAGATGTAKEEIVSGEKLPQLGAGEVSDNNIFSVTLTGLEPGATYIYTISAGGSNSEPHTFATEAVLVPEFKLLVFGDSQSGKTEPTYQPWRETVHNAFAQYPDARFFVNVGDLVEIGQSYDHWKSWFEAARGVIDTITAMPVLGNHEMYGSYEVKDDSSPVYYLSQFKLPQNGPAQLKGQAYSYDYGCAHFAVLDSQEDEEEPMRGDILEAQRRWLENDLSASSQTWKIVFFHKPPYNNKFGRPNPRIKAAFCPVFDKYHVDVVFNGHEHAVYRTYPIKSDKIRKKPKDGTIYYTTGRSGAKFYNDVGPTKWDAFAYNPSDQPCYEAVQVSRSKLLITARRQDGTVIDTFAVVK